jgi:hypothetical protein
MKKLNQLRLLEELVLLELHLLEELLFHQLKPLLLKEVVKLLKAVKLKVKAAYKKLKLI